MNNIIFLIISFMAGAAISYLGFLSLKKTVNFAFDKSGANKPFLMMLLGFRFAIEVLVLIFFVFYVKLNIWCLFSGWFLTQAWVKWNLR